jgi:hypothetical protein
LVIFISSSFLFAPFSCGFLCLLDWIFVVISHSFFYMCESFGLFYLSLGWELPGFRVVRKVLSIKLCNISDLTNLFPLISNKLRPLDFCY